MELTSPPYPKDGCTIKNMIFELSNLYDWISDHRSFMLLQKSELNLQINIDEKSFDSLGAKPTVQEMDRLLNVPINDLHTTWAMMRQLREKFDAQVRDFEDDWDCSYNIRQRVYLVAAAVMIYSHAFMTYERKEMKMEEAKNSFRENIKTMFQEIFASFKDSSGSVDIRFMDNDEEDPAFE